jgi:hypothetical protein
MIVPGPLRRHGDLHHDVAASAARFGAGRGAALGFVLGHGGILVEEP